MFRGLGRRQAKIPGHEGALRSPVATTLSLGYLEETMELVQGCLLLCFMHQLFESEVLAFKGSIRDPEHTP
jgi:hypothetical protein